MKHKGTKPLSLIISIMLMLLLHFVVTGNAQTLPNKRTRPVCNIRNANGLNGEHVNKVLKDSRGLMWIGTEQGLSCYNGKDITNFQMGEYPQAMVVNDMIERPGGNIVVATSNGLFMTDFSTLTCQRICSAIKEASSLCLTEDGLFVGSNVGIYLCEDDQNARLFPLETNVISQSNAVNDLCRADKHHLWVCAEKKIVRFDTKTQKMQRISLTPHLKSGSTTSIVQIDNHLYIGTTGDGLLRYDIKNQQLAPYDILSISFIRDLNMGTDGILYVSGNEPYKIDTRNGRILAEYGKQNNAKSDIELPSDGCRTYWHDNQLDISWFGFFLEGFVHNFRVRPLVHIYRYKDFDSSQLQVRSFCIHGNDILIGTRIGFFHINEQKDLVRHFTPDELGANIVTNICWFADRFVLTTYERGMRIYNPETQALNIPQGDEGLAIGHFSQISITPNQERLMAASNLGLFVFDNHWNYLRNLNYRNSKLPDSYISSLFLDMQGKAWIGTIQGLCIYDPMQDLIIASGFPEGYFNNEPSLAFNHASDGDIIAFTGNRIYKSRIDLSHFEADTLLPCGVINFIVPSGKDYLVGSSMGLFLFRHPQKHVELPFTPDVVQLTEADGLPGLSFNKQEVQRTEDGTLWMANSKGLIYITPEQQHHLADSIPARIMLYHLSIDDREQGMNTLLSLISKPQISLSWNFVSKKLSFTPLLLDYAQHTGRYYQYSIDGGKWQPALDGNKESVSRLGLGKHSLTIQLVGHPETATTYTVSVWPALQFYCEVIFLALLLLSFWALTWMRKRIVKRRQKLHLKHQLEREIAAKNAVRDLLQQQENQRQAYEREQEEMRQQRTASREFRELQHRVKAHMELERPYRSVKFRLSDLAKAVGSTPTTISLMLNQNLNTNFYDFVNRYRLEEFKRRSKDERFNHLTMQALAEQCGFKKTTFFAAFKKFEGCTPGEWATKTIEPK